MTFSVYIVNIILLVAFQFVYNIFNISIDSYTDFILVGFVSAVTSLVVHFSVSVLIYSKERKLLVGFVKSKLSKKQEDKNVSI